MKATMDPHNYIEEWEWTKEMEDKQLLRYMSLKKVKERNKELLTK